MSNDEIKKPKLSVKTLYTKLLKDMVEFNIWMTIEN